MLPFLLVCSLASSSGHPLLGSADLETTTNTDAHVASLQKDVNLVSYIQNFKQVMAQYVNAQYSNLTNAEMEKVKQTLEEFLQNFATDLRETIENKNDDQTIVQDGASDPAFEEIKRKIVLEFPEVTNDIADKIIVKLRRNLYDTRSKLDSIIRESHNAAILNSH